MTTLETLELKANASLNDKIKMPTLRKISLLLKENKIVHDVRHKTHKKKQGILLTVFDRFGNALEINSTDPEYSYKTKEYASKLIEIIYQQNFD